MSNRQGPMPKPPKSEWLTNGEVDAILVMTLTNEHYSNLRILKVIQHYCECRDAKEVGLRTLFTTREVKAIINTPDVNDAINRITSLTLNKYGFGPHEIIEKTRELMDVDVIDFVNDDGTYKTDMTTIAPEARRCIKKFKAKNLYETDPNGMRTVIGQLIEVELYDKTKAIELLGREKNLFKETTVVQHDITSNMAGYLLESQKRADQRAVTAREVVQIEQGNNREPQDNQREGTVSVSPEVHK